MSLLVTGGCGFIGSAFVRHLRDSEPLLINIDCLYPCSSKAPDLTESRPGYVFVRGDIRDVALVRRVLAEHQVTRVVHFAAQSHVDGSFSDPLQYTADNVVGTHSLLEACRAWGRIERFVHISTDEVYGENRGPVALTEDALLQPTNPYAATKAAAEMLVHSYHRSYAFPALVVRSNNIYGPGQYPEKVIPRFFFLLKAGQALTIAGTGQQRRSFLYIDDAVAAVRAVLVGGRAGQVYNISSTDELTVLALAHQVLARLRPGAEPGPWLRHVPDRTFNDQRYWIASQPLQDLGWRQEVSFAAGLDRTLAWYGQTDTANYWVRQEGTNVALVWGAQGWIGTQFCRVLARRGWTVVAAQSRADDEAAVARELDNTNPTHLVAAIGRTRGPGSPTIDYLEVPGRLGVNLRDNLRAPLALAAAARARRLHLTYFGTGCIYTYDETHVPGGPGFTEADPPNFAASAYSAVKGQTDQIFAHQYADVALNARIRLPISCEDCPQNFLTKIISYPHIHSLHNSMTVLPDVLPCLAEAMERRVTGTVNAVNPGTLDHSTILSWYRELQAPGHHWREVDAAALAGLVAAPRSNNTLDTRHTLELFPSLPPLAASVRRILETHQFKAPVRTPTDPSNVPSNSC